MIKKLFSSQLRINMASGVLVTIVNVTTLAFAYPIYLHFLGYEKYGVWLVLATVLSFAQLGNLGIGQAVMKLVAEEHGRNDIDGIQQYITTALILLCLSGTAVLFIVLVLKNQIISVFKLSSNENTQTISWLLPYIGILSIYVLIVHALNAALSGLGRMDLANIAQSLGRIVAVTTASLLLYTGHGIESLLIGNTISYVFIHIVSLIYICRIIPVRILRIKNLNIQCGKRILHFGCGVFGGGVIGMLGSPFNKLMLSRYAGVSSIPIYEITFNGSMQVRGFIEAGLRALMPEISRIGANMTNYAKERITQINYRAMKFIFAFGIPTYCGLFILLTPLLKLWLGQKFVSELPTAFRIMLISTFISVLGVPAYYTLLGLGRVRHIFFARGITWLTCLILVLSTSLSITYLSVSVVGLCLIISWLFSSTYLIWQFYSAIQSFNGADFHTLYVANK